jgi:hypothetical protein
MSSSAKGWQPTGNWEISRILQEATRHSSSKCCQRTSSIQLTTKIPALADFKKWAAGGNQLL